MLNTGDLVARRTVVFRQLGLDDDLRIELVGDDEVGSLVEAGQAFRVNPNMQRRTISAIGVSKTTGATLAGVTSRKLPVARFRAS